MVGSSDDAQWFSWSHPDRPYVVQAFESRDDSNLQVVAVGAHFPHPDESEGYERTGHEQGLREAIRSTMRLNSVNKVVDGGHECSRMYLKQFTLLQAWAFQVGMWRAQVWSPPVAPMIASAMTF